jgi:hypothetical protein
MGVYLSEPITEKSFKAEEGNKYSYTSAEMQGLLPYIQDGEKPWRMRAFTT